MPTSISDGGVEKLNNADSSAAVDDLIRCCGSRRWAEQMILARPFKNLQQVFSVSDNIWQSLTKEDWLEAFSHHPKIGDVDSLRKKFASTKQWAEGEQKGVQEASEETLNALARGNDDYQKRFGYIFIVCATGKSAAEMLALLEARLGNQPEHEINVAMQEQNKITHIRLEKLLA